MEAVYAALLLHKSKKKVTEANLNKVLTAAGAEVDKNQLKVLIAGLEGKNIDELISAAAVATTPVTTSATTPATDDKKSEEPKKKTKKKEEPKKEEPTGIGALFG